MLLTIDGEVKHPADDKHNTNSNREHVTSTALVVTGQKTFWIMHPLRHLSAMELVEESSERCTISYRQNVGRM